MVSASSLCGWWSFGEDVRAPSSCCYGSEEEDSSICVNTCSASDCGEYSSTEWPQVFYNENAICHYEYPGRDITDCALGYTQPRSSYSGAESNIILDDNKSRNSCFILETKNNKLIHTCSSKTQDDCVTAKGYWVPFTDLGPSSCDEIAVYPPIRGTQGNRLSPPYVNSSDISLPNIGDEYQGGIYCGSFRPGGSINAQGSYIKQGANNKEASGEGFGTSNKRWALLLSHKPYGFDDPFSKVVNLQRKKYSMNNSQELATNVSTSLYDGFYNTHDLDGIGGIPTELFANIRNVTYNGFNDWYVPSIDELGFIYNNLDISMFSFSDSRIEFFQRHLYESNVLSSTVYSDKYKLGKEDKRIMGDQALSSGGMVYAQNMALSTSVANRGKVYNAKRTEPLVVFLVRRIYY